MTLKEFNSLLSSILLYDALHKTKHHNTLMKLDAEEAVKLVRRLYDRMEQRENKKLDKEIDDLINNLKAQQP